MAIALSLFNPRSTVSLGELRFDVVAFSDGVEMLFEPTCLPRQSGIVA
jgi:hypothetical protein